MKVELLGLAIAPGFAVALYVYFRDRYEKEPLSLLVKSFLLGFVMIIPAALIEFVLIDNFFQGLSVTDVAVRNFVFVGFTEEFVKFWILYVIAYGRKEFNEPFDGIVYAVMVSMGFATSENILYVMRGGLNVGIVRTFTAIPAHAVFAVLMGYFVGLAKFNNDHKGYLLLGLATAAIFHGAYDFFLSLENIELIALGSLVALAVGVRFSFKAMKILNEHSPFRYSALFRKGKGNMGS